VRECAIETVVSKPFEQNSYILWLHGQTAALVVDPGFETAPIFELLKREGLTLAAILNTHGHVDHIAGNAAMKQAFPDAPIWIGRNDRAFLVDPARNMSASYGMPITSPDADRVVADGDQIEVAGFQFDVREIPGHSPGSVVFICSVYEPPFVLGGDVLFAGSIGRTDLGGNLQQLVDGIRNKLFTLPDATLVFPGHGPTTTVGAERRTNPFAGEAARLYGMSS
jgi:glyoxylase-like metal-dependent hydrolase (beta-lactamase superfamily II)